MESGAVLVRGRVPVASRAVTFLVKSGALPVESQWTVVPSRLSHGRTWCCPSRAVASDALESRWNLVVSQFLELLWSKG